MRRSYNTAGRLLNFLCFMKNYPACRLGACKTYQQSRLGMCLIRKIRDVHIFFSVVLIAHYSLSYLLPGAIIVACYVRIAICINRRSSSQFNLLASSGMTSQNNQAKSADVIGKLSGLTHVTETLTISSWFFFWGGGGW